MMSVFTILWLAFAAVVTALSSSGSRLLVVLDEGADKAAFSTFWGDLEGRELASTAIEKAQQP